MISLPLSNLVPRVSHLLEDERPWERGWPLSHLLRHLATRIPPRAFFIYNPLISMTRQ